MDFRQAIHAVRTRILELQPDCVSRVLGALLVCLNEDQIVDLALAPDLDTELIKFINSTFNQHTPLAANPIDPSICSSSMPLQGHRKLPAYQSPMLDVQLQNQSHLGVGSSPAKKLNLNNLRGARMSGQGVSSSRDKACHYFNKGHCLHGNDCRFSHGVNIEDSFSRMRVTDPNEIVNDGQMFSSQAVEQLESEIREILKASRGIPVTIDTLPMIYQEKYGKILQADGKAVYNLKKLLSVLKNSFRVIDRPRGQQAIVLAEDAPKYMDFRMERNDPGPIVSGSKKLYMTFAADSTFTELDVATYFSSCGTVEDVRFPLVGRRNYAFVTFTSAETVMQILAMGNPHYICGARVLVKPYREKLMPSSDRYEEKLDTTAMYGASLYADTEPDSYYPIHAGIDTSTAPWPHFLDEQEKERQAYLAGLRNFVHLLFTQLPGVYDSPNTNLVLPTVNNDDDFGYIEDILSTDESSITTDHDRYTAMQ